MNELGNPKGPIAWMARNSVAANLLMAGLIIGGLIMATQIRQEVFPEYDLDQINIQVPYPGAGPEEVEQGIVLAVEEAVRGLDGVKRVTSTANEGGAGIQVELHTGTDGNKALQDVKNAVDRITSFPENAERPVVQLVTLRREVITLVIYADQDESVLRQIAETVREDLLEDERITSVELSGVRPLEISVEVPQENLRAYNLTLEQVAREVNRGSLELPAGGVKTDAGEILLRTAERRDYGYQFADIPILSRPDGTKVRLGEIGDIRDGFRDVDIAAFFNGKRAVMINVYRVGEETPIEVAAAVKEYLEVARDKFPPGIEMAVMDDRSEVYLDRLNLLLKNAGLGLILVLILLGLTLEMRLAFWITLGIPVSFLGSLLILPAFNVSINMVSLFAFIITLGIIVDDAILVGENIHEFRTGKRSYLDAAIEGARYVSVPLVFAILTNVAAFMPLLFVSGGMGRFFGAIPIVVISVFSISLIESLFVLPAHLGHQKPPRKSGVYSFIYRRQQKISDLLQWFIRKIYTPILHLTLRNRYITILAGLAILGIVGAYIKGGHISFIFMPRVEADWVRVTARMPFGVPVEETERVKHRLHEAALRVVEENGGRRITRGIFTLVGAAPRGGESGSHIASVTVYLVPLNQRKIGSFDFSQKWRQTAGDIPGVESMTFGYAMGPSGGAAINIELSHRDPAVLEAAANRMASELGVFDGVKDIDNGFSAGKPQLDLRVRPEARSLGITAMDLARQVRSAFYGSEALRQQRGRDEIRVMVRLPECERRSEYNVEELLIRTPTGGEMPLGEAAEVDRGRSYTSIRRAEGRRVLNVTADVEEGVGNAERILASVESEIIPRLQEQYPNLQYSLEGERRARNESLGSLSWGFLMALIGIYAMLAIPFKSYFQPLVIMVCIPFGIVGAVVGHLIMGYDISLISLMGIVALAGVVVNDSLVLIDTANRTQLEGEDIYSAVVHAGTRRFRPIILTSLTTFFGLAPMIFETSRQARFLIPMAISLGFGVLFATVIALILVPSLYLSLEDGKRFLAWAFRIHKVETQTPTPELETATEPRE